jgi:radical SAM protein with 4Fe4S-binding SPASM domain
LSAPSYVRRRRLPDLDLWARLKDKRAAMSFDLELTARCNLNCRHCYINLPAGDRAARARELAAPEIDRIAGEAVSLGAVWCLVTGGEPLLRPDFFEVYEGLRRRGLLVSLYTNATLVDDEHIKFLRRHPPRDIEVTVYGVTQETYERVTRVRGSFAAFERGLERLLAGGLPVRLKAMALRSNLSELEKIAAFCRSRTKDHFRFDPFLHFRFDGDAARNRDIETERLSPEEIAALERSDAERFGALEEHRADFVFSGPQEDEGRRLFRCGAGKRNFVVGHDGRLKICLSLLHPDFLYDLRQGSLAEAWAEFIPRVLGRTSNRPEYLDRCARCPIINLCLWCPANAYLECGELDRPVEYFGRVAHARAAALGGIDIDKCEPRSLE